MMAISCPQYVWTLFTKPLTARLDASLTTGQAGAADPRSVSSVAGY